jgi:hypothetical protein
LPPERNDPCPCGSGKKYKKCCGAEHISPPDYIGVNRAIAYKGAVGRARRGFCEAYTGLKMTWLADIENRVREDLGAQSKTASCGKGCTHCCKLFVVASLQECEAIVYWLYQHEEVLQHFLKSFDTWKERIFRVERYFRTINDLHQKITSGQGTPEDRKRFDAACVAYALADISCPFIREGACSIYEVRPYVCAGVVATTPRDWCGPLHPRHKEAVYYKVSVKSSGDMPYFALPASSDVIASMPSLVFDILHGGYSTLATVPGLSKIKNEALADNEVQAVLANLRQLPY